MGVDRMFEDEDNRREAESLHRLRKLLVEFSTTVSDQYGHWTIGMVNSFLIKKGWMKHCNHERVIKITLDSPQGLRHGLRCPDCDESVYFSIGETEGELYRR